MRIRTAPMASAIALALAAPLGAMTLAATPAQAQAQSEAPSAHPTYTAAQFFETTSYGLAGGTSAGAFSPDGRSLLISSDQSGVFNAYALPLDGGEARPLTASESVAHFAVSHFPNDGRILYEAESGGGGSELTHIHVRGEDGQVRDLTPGDNVKAEFAGWSADGRTFYVTSNARDPQAFDLLALDADDYESRVVFQNPGGFTPSAVSRDGRYVALTREITSANSDVYLFDTQAGGEPVLITRHEGNVAHGVYDFTPDSAALIYATNEHGEFNQAWRHDLSSGDKAPYLAADWDVMFVAFSPSGRYRVSGVNADASTELALFDMTENRPVILTGVPDGDLASVRFSRDESTIAFTVRSDTSPSDIFVADLASGQARRLTQALNPAIDEGALVEASIIRFPSFDGVQIPGVLYRPKDASSAAPAPAIVMVHGGPGGQARRGYSAMIQHLVNHGYAVLDVNNRGSTGYGKTFFHMDDRRHGEEDLRDVVEAGNWLRAQDWVADDQVAVMGGSYGGFMTAAALAFHPETFEAGINIFGVTNWVRTLESIPPWWGAFREALFDEMGDPATDAERHRRISPLFHAANIRRPMLVVQGANDPRVLQAESDDLVAAARANGAPVEYVLFPDEGHGFLKRDNRITAQEAYLKFLNEHVRD